MGLNIVRRQGLDDFEVVAYWAEGEGMTAEADDPPRFVADPVYEQYDRELVYAEFDGPDLFAVPADAAEGSVDKATLQEYQP